MSARPDRSVLAPFLELAGADPVADPERYDALQREICDVWNRGASLREWAERVRAAGSCRAAAEAPCENRSLPETGPLSWDWDAVMSRLRRRYAPPC